MQTHEHTKAQTSKHMEHTYAVLLQFGYRVHIFLLLTFTRLSMSFIDIINKTKKLYVRLFNLVITQDSKVKLPNCVICIVDSLCYYGILLGHLVLHFPKQLSQFLL